MVLGNVYDVKSVAFVSLCESFHVWLIETINQHQINLIEIVPTAVKPVNESISIYSFFSGNHLARTRVATAQRIRSKCPIYRVDKKRKPHWFMNNLINFQSSLTPLSGCQAKILSSVVPEHEVTSPIGSWDTVICVWRCILENITSKRESQTSFLRFFTQTCLDWKRLEAMAWYLATSGPPRGGVRVVPYYLSELGAPKTGAPGAPISSWGSGLWMRFSFCYGHRRAAWNMRGPHSGAPIKRTIWGAHVCFLFLQFWASLGPHMMNSLKWRLKNWITNHNNS